jgi:hypothetical protein
MMYTNMDLEELRWWLEKRLRVEELPEPIWKKLRDRRYARAGLDEQELVDLEDVARDFLDVFRAGSGRPAPTTKDRHTAEDNGEGGQYIEVELGEYERQRKRAATKVLARYVGLNEDAHGNKVIADFRQRWLNGRLLDPEQAREFLRKSTAASDALSDLASRWAKFYAWEEKEMAWTILTGEAPQLEPLDVRVLYHGLRPTRIVMTAEHWLPAEAVERNFRETQRRLLGGDRRRPSTRSLKVLEFVEDQIRSEGARPSWRELLRRWNAEFPKESFKDAANFHRVYHRALEKVAHPSLRLIGRKRSPTEQCRMQRQAEEARAAEARLLRMFEAHVEKSGNWWPDGES